MPFFIVISTHFARDCFFFHVLEFLNERNVCVWVHIIIIVVVFPAAGPIIYSFNANNMDEFV